MKDKVIVTGGAGFIASNLTDALVANGFDVHIIDDLSVGKSENVNVESTFHKKSIVNYDDILPIFKGAKFVFHLAAMPRVQYSIDQPFETAKVNIDGTLHVLQAAKEAGVKRVIYSASSAAYGDQLGSSHREDLLPNPKSPYGLQKLVGEFYSRIWSDIYGLETISLRYFNVYGPRQSIDGAYAMVIAKFIHQKKNGLPLVITGDGTQRRDFVHVRDVVKANILAMNSSDVGHGEVFNIGSGKNYSINEIAEMIGGQIQYIPPRLEPRSTLADTKLAKKILGWTAEVRLEDGIRELLDIQ